MIWQINHCTNQNRRTVLKCQNSKNSYDEVEILMKKLAPKHCEIDSIPTKIPLQCLESLLPTITQIINLSLDQSIFSRDWKTAVVRPLLKKSGMELVPSSYRPVSNLPYLSKVVEKAMLTQFEEHCKKHHLLSDYQSVRPHN